MTSAATVRPAREEDLPRIVELLADDPLGAAREDAGDAATAVYHEAFDAIASDPRHELVVLQVDGRVAGTLHLTFLPSLTYRGRTRAHVEAVRVAREERGAGYGEMLIAWAIERARAEGCCLVQLTTDKQRPDAIAFYEHLGFRASHEGMKLHLP